MTAVKAEGVTAPPLTFRSRAEAREVIERTLQLVEEDESLAPHLRAAGLRERLRIDDLDLTVTIAAGSGDRCLEWSFARRPLIDPRISLTMDGEVANSILQGTESIGVAIARGRIRVKGDAAAALVHLPATRLLSGHYSELIARDYEHLVIR